ncbi:hypothetical protein [Pseudoxanthomonas sp. JBR18]|uniref:hypothetical protein n=1 Tax=Pseudoxanthomonas sp. JBR18 TaxID=2969308 RepID=UPI002305F8F5|nr:hypothetical protein [Pseudoxanthomonas sp. JBR18]WCE04103.1 hypothetical protein PJ250_18835 [Pseudoxanthomonas sp. JBR18]
MKLLCSSSSLAFIHTLRIALEGEDIATYISDAETTSLSSVAGPIGSSGRLYVLHEEGWDRAIEIMGDFSGPDQPSAEVARSRKPMPVWLVVGATTLLTAVLVGLLSN